MGSKHSRGAAEPVPPFTSLFLDRPADREATVATVNTVLGAVEASQLGVTLLSEALMYVLPGAVLWLGLLQTGAHPTLAGVVLGLVQLQLPVASEQAAVLAELRLVSRQTLALLCGSPASVEAFARRLFLIGVPRNQVLADVFLPHA